MNLIYLDISGKLFLTSSDNFSTYPNTLLGKMFSIENKDLLKSDYTLNNRQVYYFDRDPKIFSHIINFYRNRITYIPKKINKHICWKELMYWGFEYEKPSNIDDKIWLRVRKLTKKISKCLTEKLLPDFFVCDIEYNDRFFLDKESKLGDISGFFINEIINIIKHIINKNCSKSDSDLDFLNLNHDNLDNNLTLDITPYKIQINNVLSDIYFNSNFFNYLYTDSFDNYLEFYLSTHYNMQLNIRFSTYNDFSSSGSYIEYDNIYFGINHNFIKSDHIKTYYVSQLSFH